MNPNDLKNELARLLNQASRENGSNTPDFILAEYLMRCLEAFEAATQKREVWYGRERQLGFGKGFAGIPERDQPTGIGPS